MSRSQTITEEGSPSRNSAEWLRNPHAGEILRMEFLEPLGLDAGAIADLIGVEPSRITDMVSGRRRVDAELDLRLGRYFRMSEGFFLRLQDAFELLEQRRALGHRLDEIVPRAA